MHNIKIKNGSLGFKSANGKSYIGFIVFAVCYVAYTSIYIARLNLSMASSEMIAEGLISTDRIGILSGAFFIVFAAGRLISGKLSDKVAPFIMISVGLVLTGISNVIFGFFPPFVALVILWSANALAQSMLWSAVLCVVSSVFDSEKARKMTSYAVTSVAVGNIAAILFNTYLINHLGLAFAFAVPGGITIIMSLICCFTLRKIPAPKTAPDKKSLSLFKLISENSVKNVAITSFAHGIIKDNVTVWMTVYLADTYGVNLSEVSAFVFFVPLVGFVGRIAYPAVLRICRGNEHTVSLIGLLLCISAVIPLFTTVFGPAVSVICLSIIYMAVSLINTTVVSIYPLNYTENGNVASVSGLMDFCSYIGAGIGSVVSGYIITHFGYGSMFGLWAAVSLFALFPVIALLKSQKAL